MRRLRQENYFPILVLIHFAFWAIDLALYKGAYEFTSKTVAGEVFSSWVVTVLAANFLMATRARWVERIFGGLDKMYMIHRRSAVIACLIALSFLYRPARSKLYDRKTAWVCLAHIDLPWRYHGGISAAQTAHPLREMALLA